MNECNLQKRNCENHAVNILTKRVFRQAFTNVDRCNKLCKFRLLSSANICRVFEQLNIQKSIDLLNFIYTLLTKQRRVYVSLGKPTFYPWHGGPSVMLDSPRRTEQFLHVCMCKYACVYVYMCVSMYNKKVIRFFRQSLNQFECNNIQIKGLMVS